MTAHILIAIVAIAGADIIEAGKTVGTASNQYLLGMLIVGLIFVVIYRERQQNKQHDATLRAQQETAEKAENAVKEATDRNDKIVQGFATERTELYARMERQTAEMNEERRARWTMMIDVIRENTIAFRGCREAIESLKTFLIDTAKKN